MLKILQDRYKATYRMTRTSLVALEKERLARIAKGVSRSDANRSALVVEAVLRAFGGKQ